MTDEQARDLGRRALAAGYRWMAGALVVERGMFRLVTAGEYGDTWLSCHGEPRGYCVSVDILTGAWPDFRDPASLGTLVAQCRERWGVATMHATHHGGARPWRVWMPGDPIAYGTTEAEAWVAALEAAPDA